MEGSVLAKLSSLPGNNRCIDCSSISAKWVNLSLGAFVCIRCAGIHRDLGFNVKSIDFQSWSSAEVRFLQSRGNRLVIQIFEKHLTAQEKESRSLTQLIRDKYVAKMFCTQTDVSLLEPNSSAELLPLGWISYRDEVGDHGFYGLLSHQTLSKKPTLPDEMTSTINDSGPDDMHLGIFSQK